ncbi:MAG: MBL fold metallo-hydrolase [Asticcacaulis sp.]
MIPYVYEPEVDYGRAVDLAKGVRRVTARNPGPFTYTGTGTYLVGTDTLAVIDPGPDDKNHLQALIAAIGKAPVKAILITHRHRDHCPLARALSRETGAPVMAAPGPDHTHAPASAVTEAVAIEEDIDALFQADVHLVEGQQIDLGDQSLRVLETPGHSRDHLCFALDPTGGLFCGDHIMGWSTSVIAPPDGHMGAYMASLKRVQAEGFSVLWPTHGPPITTPAPFIEACIHHRLRREQQILRAVHRGYSTPLELVAELYSDVDRRLWPAASLSVRAHLEHLEDQGRVILQQGQWQPVG